MDINDNPPSFNDIETSNLKHCHTQDGTVKMNMSNLKENILNGTETENNKSLPKKEENGMYCNIRADSYELSYCDSIIDPDCSEISMVTCKNSNLSSSLIEGFNNLKIVDETLNISATDCNLSTVAEGDEKSVASLTDSKLESFLDKFESGDKSASLEQDSKSVAANGDVSNLYTDENILDSSLGNNDVNSVVSILPLDCTGDSNENSDLSTLDVTVIESVKTLDKPEVDSIEPILNESAKILDDSVFLTKRNSNDIPSISEIPLEFKIPVIPIKTTNEKTDQMKNDAIELSSPELSKPTEDKIEEDEFQDAAQFFKDPNSFQYLENLSSSSHSKFIQRSSLFIKFDPLHSKDSAQETNTLEFLSKALVTPSSSQRSEGSVDDINCKFCEFSPPADLKEQSRNVLISFDSPLVKVIEKSQPSELNQELSSQDTYLKQSREIAEMLKKQQDANSEIEKLKKECTSKNEEISELNALLASQDVELVNSSGMCRSWRTVLEEFSAASSAKIQSFREEIKSSEENNKKLQEEYSTSLQDLQNVENTFADFHKRYEQCKTMLKAYKDNEGSWEQQVENLKSQLGEHDQKYLLLKSRTEEILEKAEADSNAVRKSSEAQITVLTAQLKKSELKISSLESDLKQVKIENIKLSSICDELMAKVGTA